MPQPHWTGGVGSRTGRRAPRAASTAPRTTVPVLLVVAVMAVLTATRPASAQPGPSQPLTVAEARAAGEALARAHGRVGAPAEQLAVSLDAAQRLERLSRVRVDGVAGGPRSIEPGAEDTLRRITGFGFNELTERTRTAWEDCVTTAARLHAVDASAQTCARQAMGLSPRAVALQSISIVPPPGYVDDGANAAAARYERARTALTAAPGEVLLRHDVAGMQLASFDFDGAIATLAPVAGQVDADLAAAVAHLGAGRVDEAERRMAVLQERAPTSPAVNLDLGLLLASRRYEHAGAASIPVTRRGLDALLRYLCLRSTVPAVAANEAAWDLAADTAANLEHDLNGGTYWFYSTGRPQPPPFLPDSVLSPRMRTARPGVRPRWTCAEVLGGAVRPPRPAGERASRPRAARRVPSRSSRGPAACLLARVGRQAHEPLALARCARNSAGLT
ncbi:MAG: hypothetical protein WCJ30_15605 [Deltaproteobacteria bacterium]